MANAFYAALFDSAKERLSGFTSHVICAAMLDRDNRNLRFCKPIFVQRHLVHSKASSQRLLHLRQLQHQQQSLLRRPHSARNHQANSLILLIYCPSQLRPPMQVSCISTLQWCLSAAMWIHLPGGALRVNLRIRICRNSVFRQAVCRASGCSTPGNTITKKRNRLAPGRAKQLVFLHENIDVLNQLPVTELLY